MTVTTSLRLTLIVSPSPPEADLADAAPLPSATMVTVKALGTLGKIPSTQGLLQATTNNEQIAKSRANAPLFMGVKYMFDVFVVFITIPPN